MLIFLEFIIVACCLDAKWEDEFIELCEEEIDSYEEEGVGFEILVDVSIGFWNKRMWATRRMPLATARRYPGSVYESHLIFPT